MFQFHTDWCDTIKCANAQSQSPTWLRKIALIWLLTFLVHAEKVQSHRPGEECHQWDSSQMEERCCHLKLWDTTVTKCINNTISLNTNKFRVLLCCCGFSWPAERGGVFSILCSRGRTWCQWQWRRTPGSPRCQSDSNKGGTETLHDKWLVVRMRSGLKTFISPSWCLSVYLVAPVKVQPLTLRQQTHRQHLHNWVQTNGDTFRQLSGQSVPLHNKSLLFLNRSHEYP